MKSFTKLYSDFWINFDNRELIDIGVDAQLMALYLQGNSHHNMLGVYYLPLLYAASDLKLSVKKVQCALDKLCQITYCKYDEKTQYVWICNMALEQIGEEIVAKDNKDNKDNRIKAIQAIWDSLSIKIEFLPEVYNKYHNIFNLKSRFTNSSYNKTKSNSPTENLITAGETHLNVDAPADIINIEQEKEPIIDDHPSIFPAIDLSLNPTSSFEGVSCDKAPLQSPSVGESSYNFSKTNVEVTLTKGEKENYSSTTTCSDTSANTQGMVSKGVDENKYVTSTPSEGVVNSLEDPLKDLANPLGTPSKGLTNPFEAPFKGLQSLSEAPSEPLQSNIEYISKNIEEINKKEEKDLKKIEKEEEKKKTNNVLFSNSGVQTQPKIFNSLSLKPIGKFNHLEETEKAGAVDAKKQLIAHKSCNLPVVTTASKLETNSAPVFSVSSVPAAIPVALIMRNNSVVPVVHAGSVVNASSDAITTIFEHWKITMKYPEAKLDCKRRGLILDALNMGYSVQQLCYAVTGCFLTPHNRGETDGQYYDGLHIIFGDADHIERFIRNFHHPPKKETEAEKRLRENRHALKTWHERKFGKST